MHACMYVMYVHVYTYMYTSVWTHISARGSGGGTLREFNISKGCTVCSSRIIPDVLCHSKDNYAIYDDIIKGISNFNVYVINVSISRMPIRSTTQSGAHQYFAASSPYM